MKIDYSQIHEDWSAARPNVNRVLKSISENFTQIKKTQQSTVEGSLVLTVSRGNGADVAEVLIQVTDSLGVALPGIWNIDVWLSDSADGAGLTATTATGTVGAKADFGALLGTYTAKKAFRAQTRSDGSFTLTITDTARTPFWCAAQVPQNGKTLVSRQLNDAAYG